MTRMIEMAKDLGKALAQTDEYQVLKRTVSNAEGDQEMQELRVELEALEAKIQDALKDGSEPETSLKESYEKAVGQLQSNPTYQRLVSAQANFDKVLLKINRTIQEGISEGAESRIILP
ncbi:MAG: YlbF family regulator [Gemmatimonadota bacterium]|uniref:YlbF family regulator n=1 Tax=marine metagenome TaxID=408172 RepID=A0A382CCP2_9ZZZZ|nr:YlbF family regulator [Gemmatimonadota bacterium]